VLYNNTSNKHHHSHTTHKHIHTGAGKFLGVTLGVFLLIGTIYFISKRRGALCFRNRRILGPHAGRGATNQRYVMSNLQDEFPDSVIPHSGNVNAAASVSSNVTSVSVNVNGSEAVDVPIVLPVGSVPASAVVVPIVAEANEANQIR